LFGKGLKGDKKLRDMSDGAEITAEVETAATLIQKARNPLILSSPSLFGASLNVALLKGKAVAVGFEANSRGTALMGLATDGKTYKEMVSGGMKVLYAIGEVPLAKRPDSGFLVVQNAYKTELAQQADIVLPSAATLESSGTVVDSFGRMKHLSCVTVPFGESRVHRDIFISLSGIMGTAIKKPGAAEIKRAVRVRQKLTASPFEKRDDINILPDSISEDINSSVIISSRLAWLRESAKVQAV
jgi:NADH dehydrogenase/NADH:ubiquinone oxidoreductase subunit G